jgi:hypothetical protein
MKIVLAMTAVFAMALSVGVLSQGAGPVQAVPVEFVVNATGASENPPVSGAGTALGVFTFDKATKQLTFFVRVNGISSDQVTAAHIHRGAVGVNGPIVHPLSLVAFENVSGMITLSDADIADLEAGRLYLNVHSVGNPGGFARGQMILPGAAPAPAPTATTTPGAVSPPSTGDGGLADTTSASWLALAGIVLATSAGTLAFARRGV